MGRCAGFYFTFVMLRSSLALSQGCHGPILGPSPVPPVHRGGGEYNQNM